jgi:hypothetical protein
MSHAADYFQVLERRWSGHIYQEQPKKEAFILVGMHCVQSAYRMFFEEKTSPKTSPLCCTTKLIGYPANRDSSCVNSTHLIHGFTALMYNHNTRPRSISLASFSLEF